MIEHDDGTTPNVDYAYDRNSNRSRMDDGTGATTYLYDELDRLLAVTSPGSSVVGYRYDLDGNRTKLIYPDGMAVSYAFDEASRLTYLVDWVGRVMRYWYRPDGSVMTTQAPNGCATQYRYDCDDPGALLRSA